MSLFMPSLCVFLNLVCAGLSLWNHQIAEATAWLSAASGWAAAIIHITKGQKENDN